MRLLAEVKFFGRYKAVDQGRRGALGSDYLTCSLLLSRGVAAIPHNRLYHLHELIAPPWLR
jgi:hypothetical protein